MTRLRILPLFVLIIAILLLAMGFVMVKTYEGRVATPTIQDSPQPTVAKAWIQIDPIGDYKMDSSFKIIGSSELVVNGTTELPAGTMVPLIIYGNSEKTSAEIEIKSNGAGPNSFSHAFNLTGLPPGRYRVQIESDLVKRKTAYRDFNITSSVSYSRWIKMDLPRYIGDRISLNGTTDLPAGSELMIGAYTERLGCENEREWNNGYVTRICKGECSDFRQVVPVAQGSGGVNTWNLTVNITREECEGHYTIFVKAENPTNVTGIQQTNV